MSGWSGLAVGCLVVALALFTAGEPVWQWESQVTGGADLWSYSLFSVEHTNTSANTTFVYSYDTLPNQPAMGSAMRDAQLWFLLGLLGAIAGTGLSAATAARKLKGLYAGIAFLAACAAILFGTLNLVLTIPPAGADLLTSGGSLPNFQGQYLTSGAVTMSWGALLGWYFLLGLGLLAGWGASDMWSVPRAKPKTARPEPEPTREELPPPPVMEEIPVSEEPSIEEVFVIASSGLLVKHMSRSLMTDKDRDVVGGMISVVSNFVREAFTERDGEVQEVTLGDHRFIICDEAGLVVAALVTRGETEDIVHRLRHLLVCLLDRYGDQIVEWQGEPLEGIEDEISVLWESFFAPPPPAD